MAEILDEYVINTKINTEKSINSAEELMSAIASLGKVVEKVGDTLDKSINRMGDDIEYLKDFTTGFAEGLAEGLGAALGEVSEGEKKVEKETDKTTRTFNKQKKTGSDLANSLSRIGSQGVKGIKRLGRQMSDLYKNTKKSADNAQNLTKQFILAGLGIKGISALINKLKSAFNYGSKNLAEYAESYNNAVSDLMNGVNQLKNNVAAALRPLAEIVLPVMSKIVDLMNEGINKGAEFIAALAGRSTYTKAVKQAEKYAEATQNSLNALEELDVIGKNGTTGEDMFTEASVSQSMKDLASVWLELVKSGNFEELGARIGAAITNALDNIPWDTIKEKARQVGEKIAEFINGFVSPALFGAIGKTLAEWINAKQEALGGFLNKLSFENLGQSLVTGIKNYLETINWETIKDNAMTAMGGLATMLNQIVDDEDFWSDVGETVANRLMTIIDGWYSFVTTFHFANFGKGIGEAINKFFTEMGKVQTVKNGDGITEQLTGWQILGRDITETAGGILKALTTALKTIKWDEVGKAIGEMLNSIDWEELAVDLADLAISLAKAIKDAFVALGKENPIAAGIAAAILLGKGAIGKAVATAIATTITTSAGTSAATSAATSTATGATMGAASGAGLSATGIGLLVSLPVLLLAATNAWRDYYEENIETAEDKETAAEQIVSRFVNYVSTNLETMGTDVDSAREHARLALEMLGIKLSANGDAVSSWYTLVDYYTNQLGLSYDEASQKATEDLQLMGFDISSLSEVSSTKSALIRSYMEDMGLSYDEAERKASSDVKLITAAFGSLSSSLSVTREQIKDVFSYTNLKSIVDNFDLIGGDAGRKFSEHFKSELATWMEEMAQVQLKPNYPWAADYGTLEPVNIFKWNRKIGAANGAVIPRTAKEHMIMVGDNNTETEIVSPLSTMKQALIEALGEVGMAGGEQINLSIDGEKLFAWVVEKNRDSYIYSNKNQLVY